MSDQAQHLSPDPQAPRRMVRRACDVCHRRKVKCDGEMPCKTCVRGNDPCRYTNPVLKKGPPRKRKASDPEESRERLQRTWPNSVQEVAGGGGFTPRQPQLEPTPLFSISPLDHTRPSEPLKSSNFAPQDIWHLLDVSRPVTPPSPMQDGPGPSSTNIPTSRLCSNPQPSPLALAMLETTILPLLDTFYDRIYRMMPIFPPGYIFGSIPSSQEYHCVSDRTSDPNFLSLILSMAALASIHPLQPHEMSSKPGRVKQAVALLEEALRLQTSSPTLEQVLTTYLAFATWSELQRKDVAELKLKDALDLASHINVDQAPLDDTEISRQFQAMHSVLAVTELVSAIFRPTTTDRICMKCPTLGPAPFDSPLSCHMQCLVSLFSNLDDELLQCWTRRCKQQAGPSSDEQRIECDRLDRGKVSKVLRRLSQEPSIVLSSALDFLSESERADALVTWQWLRNRVWTLAQTHGLTHMAEDPQLMLEAPELSTDYPVEVALFTIELCQLLPFTSMETHGRGFVEKLYNIAATPTALLMDTHQVFHGKLAEMAATQQWSDMIQALYSFVSRHRQGSDLAMPLGLALSVGPAGHPEE